MLIAYRRHRSSCKHRSRKYRNCFCPIWVQGRVNGRPVRQSLDLTGWEAAQKKVREMELGEGTSVLVDEALDRWMADCEARGLKDETLKKYKARKKELGDRFGSYALGSVGLDDLRKMRESWDVQSSSMGKRIEILRNFFGFCVESEWIQKNPAKGLKAPIAKHSPTLPFSDDQWEKIIWALEIFEESHPNRTKETGKRLKALVLLMRYAGMRISDAVALKRERIRDGKLFLYQAKTGRPVWIPLPKSVIKALKDIDVGETHYFWNGRSKLRTCVTEWSERMKKVFELAGIPDGHSHRLRDTFSVDLLSKGVPIQQVSI